MSCKITYLLKDAVNGDRKVSAVVGESDLEWFVLNKKAEGEDEATKKMISKIKNVDDSGSKKGKN